MGIQKTNLFFALSILVLGYQNCSKNKVVIDDELKSKTLAQNKILTEESSSAPKTAHFTFICPSLESPNQNPKDLLHSEDVKVVIEEYNYEEDSKRIVCEVHGVKKQILDTRSVDLSSCEVIPDQQSAHLNLFVVPENVKSGFDAHKINNDTTPLSLGGYALKYLHMDAGEVSPACDDSGDPLIVQLSPSASPSLNLTAPTEGLAFDLLGKRSFVTAHEKVQTSWLTKSESEIYFLVKPNKDGLVLGIDEMFADTTRGPDNKYSKHGFAALVKYDDNKDLLIDEDDFVYEELRLWRDTNLDGRVQESELSRLKDKKLRAIDLRYETQYREMDAFGNQSRYKSVIVMEDHSYGVILDLWLRFVHQPPAVSTNSETAAKEEHKSSEETPPNELASALDVEELSSSSSTQPHETPPADTAPQTHEPLEASSVSPNLTHSAQTSDSP